MKLSYNWLKEHVALDLSTQELSRHLLMMGFEVADVLRRGPAFSGVVTAQILEIAKHPNADRLSLCVVNDGQNRHNVVCGAKNIAVGQKVPLARVGAQLPGGFKIGRSKIRGVESSGMICSAEELGVGAANGGILVLDPGTELGADFAKAFGESDEIIDLEVTPNRPDCLSHFGLARELAAYFQVPLKTRAEPAPSVESGSCWPVRVEAPRACPRYVGRVFSGLTVGPSPAWLSSKLEAVGLRSINNLVDITNFILMDLGQPLHAFDLDRLEGGEIRVRFSAAGETIKALDGKDYALSPEILVIADAKSPQAIAGVMGGAASGVTAATKNAFLESAYFDPPVVRRASQKLRLRSDSSYRFERGADPAAALTASRRAAALINELCRPAAQSPAIDAAAEVPERAPIRVSARRVNQILGSEFEPAAVETALRSISAGFEKTGEDWSFRAPSYRGDLETVWDLAEETARLLSYEKIPARLPKAPLAPATLTRHESVARRCRRRLAGFGLLEAYNYDFVSEKGLAACRLARAEGWARLANPVSEDWTILRPTLLPGLLQNAALNARRGASAARLFEIGKVYARAGERLEEKHRLSVVLYGPATEAFWKPARTPAADVHEALGLALELLGDLLRLPFSSAPGGPGDALFNPGASLRLATPSGAVATVGELHPQAARALDLERLGVTLIDVDFEALCALERPQARFTPFSAFPFSRRDLSVVLGKDRPYALVEKAAREAAGENLLSLELVDVFEGKSLPPDARSLTLRLTFGRADRTLKDEEVSAAIDKTLAALKAATGAELRS